MHADNLAIALLAGGVLFTFGLRALLRSWL